MKIYQENDYWVLSYPNGFEVFNLNSKKEAELFYKANPVGKEFSMINWRLKGKS